MGSMINRQGRGFKFIGYNIRRNRRLKKSIDPCDQWPVVNHAESTECPKAFLTWSKNRKWDSLTFPADGDLCSTDSHFRKRALDLLCGL